MKIKSEILDLLASSCTTSDNQLAITRQLDRKQYAKLNEVLEAMGGKWSRKSKAHLFDCDAGTALESVVQTGEAAHLAKDFDFFQTPPSLVEKMIDASGIGQNDYLLEPSAGRGAIIDCVLDRFPRIRFECVELAPENRLSLQRKRYALAGDDFLSFTTGQKYDAILANPPFSKQQDIRHVDRMLDLLSPGGVLVSVMSASVTFRTNTLTISFRERVASMGGEILMLPDGTFKDSGTMVKTCLVKARAS